MHNSLVNMIFTQNKSLNTSQMGLRTRICEICYFPSNETLRQLAIIVLRWPEHIFSSLQSQRRPLTKKNHHRWRWFCTIAIGAESVEDRFDVLSPFFVYHAFPLIYFFPASTHWIQITPRAHVVKLKKLRTIHGKYKIVIFVNTLSQLPCSLILFTVFAP